jgi:hypothetical protein
LIPCARCAGAWLRRPNRSLRFSNAHADRVYNEEPAPAPIDDVTPAARSLQFSSTKRRMAEDSDSWDVLGDDHARVLPTGRVLRGPLLAANSTAKAHADAREAADASAGAAPSVPPAWVEFPQFGERRAAHPAQRLDTGQADPSPVVKNAKDRRFLVLRQNRGMSHRPPDSRSDASTASQLPVLRGSHRAMTL